MATKIIFDGENFVSDNKNGFKVAERIKMTLNDTIETIDFYDECPHIGVKRK